MSRGLSKEFLDAMREKLEQGRADGYVGWDCRWEDAYFPYDPAKFLLDRLHGEIDELVIALDKGDKEAIKYEAADVANFAMMIADISKAGHGTRARSG